MKKPDFIPGLELADGFHSEVVGPLLGASFPGLRYSAALIGNGSEVLGFDTPMSVDHEWGPRLMLFLRPGDYGARRNELEAFFAKSLPPTYKGFSTNYTPPDPEDGGVRWMKEASGGSIEHHIDAYTVLGFFRSFLGLRKFPKLDPLDWLTLPSQKLRSLVSGRVFHDELGLERTCARFSWYPHDIWLYLLGSAWNRIGQEEHLMGRAGSVGDEIGSAIIGSRLARDVMRLAFLLERSYFPYAKWFGTAFSKLDSAPKLGPLVAGILGAKTWKEREACLVEACKLLIGIQNALGIAEPLKAEASAFWTRPFMVVWGEKIAEGIFVRIKDDSISAIAQKRHFGSIDLFSDNTDFLSDASLNPRVRALYDLELKKKNSLPRGD